MADDASACAALAPRRLAHRGHSLALSGPSAAPRMPRATRRGLRCSATAASKTSRTDPRGCPPCSRVLHRLAAEAVALRRRLPALSTEQTSGGTAFHQLQEARTSQRKHRMLPQFTQLCAAQRTGHATQSRPSVWPRGCLRKAWQRVLASSAAMPSARASEERGHNHFWNRVSPKKIFFELDFVVNRYKRRHTRHDAKHTIARTAPYLAPAPAAPPTPAPPRWERDEEMGQRRRKHKHVWEGSVMRHAARRFSLSGTAPPF